MNRSSSVAVDNWHFEVGADEVGTVNVVALGTDDSRVGLQLTDRVSGRLPRLDLDQLEAASAEITTEVDIGFLAGCTALRRARARGPLDDHRSGEKVTAGVAGALSRTLCSCVGKALGAAKSPAIVAATSVTLNRDIDTMINLALGDNALLVDPAVP